MAKDFYSSPPASPLLFLSLPASPLLECFPRPSGAICLLAVYWQASSALRWSDTYITTPITATVQPSLPNTGLKSVYMYFVCEGKVSGEFKLTQALSPQKRPMCRKMVHCVYEETGV